eukprot:UN4019
MIQLLYITVHIDVHRFEPLCTKAKIDLLRKEGVLFDESADGALRVQRTSMWHFPDRLDLNTVLLPGEDAAGDAHRSDEVLAPRSLTLYPKHKEGT